ncbi:MAG: hypothetical protein U9N61_10960 [Euryarchaeota archaeon]|nr:hypothetical protein [Euryarchaeota archaeon]
MTKKAQMVKMRAGEFRVPVVIRPENGRLFFQFGFNRPLMAEIKAMKGARWHGFDDTDPKKEWSVSDCGRNRFQIAYLRGQDPYTHYNKPLLNITPNRDVLYEHQVEMVQHGLTRRQCILACEMRTGKTLAAIEIMEQSGLVDWVWVGPKSSLPEIQLQFEEWDAKIKPRFMTYDRFRIDVQEGTFVIPNGIIFDESTKLKNRTSQRSQAAEFIAEEMRAKNTACFIIEMSGAPAPKSPIDWWHQCEVVCPGFLREGDDAKFKKRLALIEEKESFTGGTYPELVTWFDNEKKCAICGKFRDEHFDDDLTPKDHPFEPSKNEVSYLYQRMQGLVLVKFRKDCLDLPETQYRTIRVEPTESTKRAANLILKTSPRTVTALMLSRELSDGFQYKEEVNGTETCPLCKGSKVSLEWYDPEDPDNDVNDEAIQSGRCEQREEPCSKCKGGGETPKLIRIAKEVPCPKEQVLIDLLDEHEPVGRFVVYAGFQASVDRCVKIALRYQWDVIRIDGRGWAYSPSVEQMDVPESNKEMLKRFQSKDGRKIVIVAQPGAAGMGLTLTASPSVFFYSNSFNAEDRIQAAERIQGIGMDLNRGATVIDVVHLDIDQYVLDNLAKKLDLLNLTMGKLREAVLEGNDAIPRR